MVERLSRRHLFDHVAHTLTLVSRPIDKPLPGSDNTRSGARLPALPFRRWRVAHVARAAVWTNPGVAVIDHQKEPEMPGKDRKRWTVLIYMVADDPQGGELLDRLAVREMDQITKATLSVRTRSIFMSRVQVDFRTLPGVWRR